MKSYLQANKEWDATKPAARRALLKKFGRDPILAARTYHFLPRVVRQDIQPTLLSKAAAKGTPAPNGKQYWWVEA